MRRIIGLFCNDVLSYLWPLGAAASALPLSLSLSLSILSQTLSLSSPSLLLSLPLFSLCLSLPSLSLSLPPPLFYICLVCWNSVNFALRSTLKQCHPSHLLPFNSLLPHSLVIYQDVAFFTSDEGPLYYHSAGATKK